MGKAKTSSSKGWIFKSILACALIIAVAVPLAILTGCSDNPVNQPSNQNGATLGNYFDEPYQELSANSSANKSNFSYVTAETESEVSAENGGIVPLELSGETGSLEVPGNSVNEDILITAQTTVLSFFGKSLVFFDFQPDGLVFSNPANLQISASVLSSGATSGKLYWLNPSNRRWVYQGSTMVDGNGMLNFPINHFSKYGISN